MTTQRALLSLLLIFGCILQARAQTQTQYDKGTPPQFAAGVSSLGSYMSTEFGTVNLSNGSLNFNIPLGKIGGRGNVDLPLVLSYSSKVWSASMDVDTERESSTQQSVAFADYDNQSSFAGAATPGWSLRGGIYLSSRFVKIGRVMSGPSVGCYTFGLHKLTLNLPDRGEVEFRDDATNGAPLLLNCSTQQTASRGTRWHATDGSGAIFTNDVDNGVGLFPSPNLSGTIILADGTRLGSTTNGAIVDRNGNKITGTFDGITDQLGRTTTIQYGAQDPDNASVTLAILVTVPGYQGTPRYYKIKTGIMNQYYRSDINPTLPVVTGDWDPEGWDYLWPGAHTNLFPRSYGLYAQRIDAREVLTEVVLPDGRSLKFRYNEFGEVAEVELPTGAKIQYDYGPVTALPTGVSPSWETTTNGAGSGIVSDVKRVDRAVKVKRTYPDGVNLEAAWNFGYGSHAIGAVTYPATVVIANSSTGAPLSKQRHIFLQAGRYTEPYGSQSVHDGTHYTLWSTGVEWRVETLNGADTVLAATEKDWSQRAPVSWSTYMQEQPANDNRVNQSRGYLENSMMTKVETTYDQYNNPIEVREYDFDQSLKRRTTTSYLSWNNGVNYQTNDSIHMLSLPETTTVYNAAGTQVAQTLNDYDNYTDDGNHALLTSYGTVSQHDSANYGVAKLTRGNVTRIGHWLNTTDTFIYSYFRFDVLGNIVSTKDANGNVATVSFADDFGTGQNPGTPTQNPATATYALPTLITSPPQSPGAPVHTARSQYDYSTGLLTGFRDRNNTVTQTIYNDPFNRPTQVKTALGVPDVESHTAMYYAPATVSGITLSKNDTLTVADLNTTGDGSLRSWTVTDGFGRTTQSWTGDPQGDVEVITIYDGLGRVKQVSNPFRPATESAAYTTTVYDLLGRVTSVTTPDTAAVNTSYAANTVTVTDQAGKSRKSVSDGLGRLIEVYEDPNGFNYLTTYTYDTLNNLVKVTQGSQQRFFLYDSLKRLIRARNPEQGTHASLNLSDPITGNTVWSVGYQYDVSGNLIQKTDARGVVSSYAYDAFNRNTTIDYSDTASVNPDVKRFYDGATNGKGRFWYSYSGGDSSTGTNVEQMAVDSYDALGRPLVQRQLFKLNGIWSEPYEMERAYNRAGGVTSQIYPSRHFVTYNYNSAGRLADKDAQSPAFTGNLGDGQQRTYASGNTYSSWGSLTMERFGTQTQLYHKLQYNVRGQLWDVRVSTDPDVNGSWNRGALQMFYESTYTHGASGPENNGNVLKTNHYVPMDESSSTWAIHDQFYGYDSLNRITSVAEYFISNSQPLTQQSLQSYAYDRWGNRTINPSSWGTGINTKQFAVDSSTNRLGVPGGQSGVMSYDNAGNLVTDTYTGSGVRTYDAENRMTTAADNTGQTSRYTYDADGRRTRRQAGGAQEEWQIYGFEGELLAEYQVNSPALAPKKEYGYRNGQLLITAEPSSELPVNVASSSSGATATASSAFSGFAASGAINGDRKGLFVWQNGYWSTASAGFPAWLEVQFNGSKTITEIDVVTLQDNYNAPIEPTESTTFTQGGLTGYEVQYWNNSAWVAIPGGSVSGNNKVWKKFSFAPVTTTKIRLLTSASPDNYSRLTEVEAWTGPSPAPRYNLALASSGAVASASNSYSAGYGPSGTNNGDRKSISWSNGGGWNDSGPPFPDWLQIDFGSIKTINEVDVFTLQDNWANSAEPTESMTFTQWGLTAFTVEFWDGSNWIQIPGAGVTGNNKVWRKFTFSPISTSKIRVVITASVDGYSRLTEVEAYGPADTGGSGNGVHWLVPDHLGTPRIVLDQTGSLAGVRRHDYLPFGEELFAGTGGRTVAMGYTSDGVRQQFTQKERDVETGLDYFLARYYSSTHGRFTSVDPDNAEGRAEPSNPQGWNAYSYVTNNPLNKIDPDGRAPEWLQKIKNALAWGKSVTNAQLAEEVKQKKEELKAKLVEMDGHKYTNQEIDNMTYRQVFWTYNRYRLGIDAGVARTVPQQPPTIPGPVVQAGNAPQHAQDTLKQIEQTGKAPPGYRGGRTFANDGRGGGQPLPKTDGQGNQITYREYDVQPYQRGVNRGAERIVRGSDGSAYYTSDHYKTFIQIK
jgi:RHS repeat-associated protein